MTVINIADSKRKLSERDDTEAIVEAQRARIKKDISNFIKAIAEPTEGLSYINDILFAELLKAALGLGIEMDGGNVAVAMRAAVDFITEPDDDDGGHNERRKLIAELVKLTGAPGTDVPTPSADRG